MTLSLSQPIAERLPATAQLLTRRDAMLALLAGGLSLALYVRTLVPFVLTGDSAEFQVLAYQLGIAHTPGYPVYLLLAKLWTFLPIRDIAYRVNLFSALMAALAVASVYLAGQLLARNRLAALFGALVLAVSFSFWSQAIIAEVYTSGAAFLALTWLGLLAWYRSGSGRALFLAGLCGGLSLGVHSTVALCAPAVLLFLWLNRRRWPGLWRPAILGAATGALLYLAIFAAVDLNAPPGNFFHAAYGPARSSWDLSQADIDSPIQRMIFIGSGAQWRSAMLGWGRLPGRAIGYIGELPRELAWPTIALSIAGLPLLFRRERSLGWLFLAALLLQWLFAFTYEISDIYVFYIAGYLLMALLAAYAAAQLGAWLARLPMPGASAIATGALLAILALGVWPQLAPHWRDVRAGRIPFVGAENYPVDGQSENLYRAVERVVDQLPPDAIVFADWNPLYMYIYAAYIDQGRLDLRFIEPAPRADKPGLPDSAIEFIDANIATHRIFFTQTRPEVERAGYRFRQRAMWSTMLYEVVR